MSVSFISVKCPECNSNLNIEEERKSAFCTYCGAKILISNDNVHIVRTIDDAKIEEAKTERIVKLKELDLEEKTVNLFQPLTIIWMIIGIIMIVISVVGFVINNIGMAVTFLVIGLLVSIADSIVIAVTNSIARRRRSKYSR